MLSRKAQIRWRCSDCRISIAKAITDTSTLIVYRQPVGTGICTQPPQSLIKFVFSPDFSVSAACVLAGCALQVDAERNGDVIERGTLEEVTKMMLELGKAVYIQELEAPFLKRSKDFFLCVPPQLSGCAR